MTPALIALAAALLLALAYSRGHRVPPGEWGEVVFFAGVAWVPLVTVAYAVAWAWRGLHGG